MANVNQLAPFILKWEGGFVNDPADLGGATNMGVTIGTWKSCGYDKDGDGDIDVDDLHLLTREDVVKRVLKPHYWDRWKPHELFDMIKIARFDFIEDICRSRPANNKFKRGWMNRINDLRFEE